MRLRIIAGGKIRERHIRVALDEYLGRIRHSMPVEEFEILQGKSAKSLQSIQRLVPKNYELWALDASGKQPTSSELAAWIEQRMSRGVKGIAMTIGGADGLPKEIISRADLKLSLSKLTLPHRLARLLLAEQLYRSMTIIRGEPYHK